jgi:hypothetical protein
MLGHSHGRHAIGSECSLGRPGKKRRVGWARRGRQGPRLHAASSIGCSCSVQPCGLSVSSERNRTSKSRLHFPPPLGRGQCVRAVMRRQLLQDPPTRCLGGVTELSHAVARRLENLFLALPHRLLYPVASFSQVSLSSVEEFPSLNPPSRRHGEGLNHRRTCRDHGPGLPRTGHTAPRSSSLSPCRRHEPCC